MFCEERVVNTGGDYYIEGLKTPLIMIINRKRITFFFFFNVKGKQRFGFIDIYEIKKKIINIY